MDTAECYRTVRGRMTELAAALTHDQAGTSVPALPAWAAPQPGPSYATRTGLDAVNAIERSRASASRKSIGLRPLD